ncbi:MAG: NAD(P)/FAD-dependent oxidoreductase [Anaerolineae bacterium]|nr:NAD(P)/FAD-dependent oxidoreductase [Anaerolineae bacterium]
MDYDVIIVGGGIAGLTAAAYVAKAGHTILLCEKESHCGGLVRTFERNGFVYDGGIRAIENSGIVFPMLRQLGLDIDFIKSPVSVGIEDRVIRLDAIESIRAYQALLTDMFPESRDEIAAIIERIRTIMGYLDVLYGIDNPLFLDMKKDRDYLLKVILPWMPKYALTIRKISALSEPVVAYLRRYTQNQSLLDMIAQHFFQDTPAFFALSYFKLYLDYNYPRGGTGTLPDTLVQFIEDHGGAISTDTAIVAVDPEKRRVTDAQGQRHSYRELIWAADLKTLYRMMNPEVIGDGAIKRAVTERQTAVADKTGGDSVFTVYLALDLDKSYFADRASAHFFYTPHRDGQSNAGAWPVGESREAIEAWLEKFFTLTTYEISCPVMRDPTLAPPGKTGLIVSVLFDYNLAKHIEAAGWYEAFKTYSVDCILNTLDASIFPGIKNAVLDRFSSTPLSLARITGNADGAITGWAFTNTSIPVEHRLPKIARAIRTPIPGILKAGQWAFSPSGLPTSILTGKLAADEAIKALKKAK